MNVTDDRLLVLGIILSSTLLTTCFLSTNMAPRFGLALALSLDGELTIDRYLDNILHPTYNPVDYAPFNGRKYSDKGPLQSFLAAPVVRLLSSAGTYFETSVYLTTVLLCGIPTAITALLILRFGRIVHRRGDIAPEVPALAYALCTPAFFYSTGFFSYALTSFMAFASFYLVFTSRDEHGPGWAIVAGALAGATGLNDYAALPIFPCLLFFCFIRARRTVLPFLGSGLFVLSLLLFYQYTIFNDPLMPTYETKVAWTDVHTRGAYMGIGTLKPEAFFGLTLGASRGLFTFSPVLIVAVVLWPRLRRREGAAAGLIIVLSVILFLLQATFTMWTAGTSVGPRFITPALPFLVLPLLTLHRGMRLWPVFVALLLLSYILNLLLASSYSPEAHDENPIRSTLAQWLWGRRMVGRVPETGMLTEVILKRPKVNLLLYRFQLNKNEALVRLPSLLAGTIGAGLLWRALRSGD